MEDVKWLLRRCGLPILLLLIFVIAGMFCWGKLHAEKQKVAEEVWEPPIEIENSEAETEEAENAEISTESAYWFIPQASDDLLSEKEKEQLQSTVLSAAESVREIYKDIVIADAPSYSSGINEFTHEQRKAVVEQLGRSGLVSVEEDTAMQNHEVIETFYADYLDGRDSMVTVFEVYRDGLIGAVTFIYRKGELQTYYIGIRWKEGGIPEIQGTSVSNVAEIKLTEKGYFIYAYEYVIAHASLRQYWRIEPLPEDCRELTEKYISGLSYVNYNVLVTNWDSSNVEDILMPCMYEDIYRISTGENLKTEDWKIPAEEYERIMTTYFPVSVEQLREHCGYAEGSNSYEYEMIYASPYPPFGEVVDYTKNADGTITLIVDGVWPDYNSDLAFRNTVVVLPFEDGTFRYLSNSIEQIELELPPIARKDDIMALKKKSILLIMAFLIGCDLCACGKEDSVVGESLVEDTEEVSSTEETKSAEEEAAEQWEKGYDLPVDEQEREEAETDCKKLMEHYLDIYETADKGIASNVVLDDQTVLEMQKKVKDAGYPIATMVTYSNMGNYESVDSFLKECMEGQSGSVVIYEIHNDGGLGRMKFIFDGTDMYVVSTRGIRNADNEPGISYISYTRLKEWKYTEKGWFCYELCVPEPPEVSEIVDGSCLIRIKPMTEEEREMSERLVMGLGYQGQNLLCSNWNAENMNDLDYNGMFEYLYGMKYGEKFNSEDYPNGIPKEEFESLIMEYLPVTAEQIREYAVFDEENQTYYWERLGCFNYAPTFFGTSLPEVVGIKENDDGTVTLTVEAVCDMVICNDAVITHELTVRFAEDGSFQYLGNEILNDGITSIPDYQYRIRKE